MLKVESYQVVFREVPDEITLALNISNCPHHCKGCHSPQLWEDIGEPLDIAKISQIMHSMRSAPITCIAFMGGDNDMESLFNLNKQVKEAFPGLKTCWYSGYTYEDKEFRMYSWRMTEFDYVKLGPYKEEYGPLNSASTNQVMFKTTSKVSMEAITHLFNGTRSTSNHIMIP